MNKKSLEIQINEILTIIENHHLTYFGYLRSDKFVSNIIHSERYTSFQINLINSFFKSYCLSEYYSNYNYNGFRNIDREIKRKMMLETYFEIE